MMMKPHEFRLRPGKNFTLILACATLFLPPIFAQEDEDEDDIFTLSPFIIEAADQTGYTAASTLAGTRIKTNLRDVGSAITVITQDFLEDTASTSVEDLLVYTPSTEIGGAVGNFAGPGAAAGDTNANNNARANPGGNTRVRGLSSASATRDYFLSLFGFDSYNTERVTVSRGPNSILFGIGEPGGIVESSLKKAVTGSEFSKISARVGSHGTYRGTLDLNRVLAEDRLAVRVNAMHENITFRQVPAYEEDSRYFLALTAVLFENENSNFLDRTILRGHWERAERNGTPPDPIPPSDLFTSWWQPPGSTEADIMTGVKPNNNWPDDWRNKYAAPQWTINAIFPKQNDPGLEYTSQPALWNSYALIYGNPTGGPTVGFNDGVWDKVQVIHGTSGRFLWTDGVTYTPGWFPTYASHNNGNYRWYGNGFRDPVIMDKNILDYENLLLQGKAQYALHNFDAHNLTLEQTFFNGKAGFEFSVDKQDLYHERFFPFGRATYAAVRIDTAVYLPNGALNPNVGRPMMNGQWDPVNKFWTSHDTERLTAFYELDFTDTDRWTKWLGKHVFTGLLSSWEKNARNFGDALSWDTGHDANQNYRALVNRPGAWGGRMFAWAYVGDAQWDARTPSDMRLYTEPLDLQLPKEGDFFNNYYAAREETPLTIKQSTVRARSLVLWPGRSRQTIDSEALTLQSRFLEEHLVVTYGLRTDESKTYEIQNIQNPDGSYKLEESWVNWKNNGDPVLAAEGDTATLQAVAHVPLDWTREWMGNPSFSVHWSESENFNPASVRRDIFNQVIQPPSGETSELGFTVGLLQDRLLFRANWYETSSKNFTNRNIQGSLWQFTWTDGFARRWLNSKNGWIKDPEENPSFEEVVFGQPNQDGYPFPADPSLIGPFNSYDEVINALLYDVLPPSTVEALNYRIEGPEGAQSIVQDSISGRSSVADLVAEGFEIEATLNITPGWRMTFNATKTESIFSNGLQSLTPYTEMVTNNLKSLGLWDMSRGGWQETVRIRDTWTNDPLSSLASAASKEGTVATELRKWRFNLVTNYSFREGFLQGFAAGGAIRWQDKVSTGYPLMRNDLGLLVPELDNPYYGGEDLTGDIWLSYQMKLRDGTNLKFQLNMVNVLDDGDPLVVTTNPDGYTAIIRSSPEKRWFFTTTLNF